ncbi:MAG: threonylcarbamoyl-AMP synthase [Candidatus Omnitrophica bacterium]|nr:threonylcarbamoyl-AMP synthase [Candidatus Omnitrophota bacterium]
MAKTATIIKVDPKDPSLPKIREVARACREGKIVAFPTETVYGIGAPMNVSNLTEILSRIKGRDISKACSYHIGEWEMLAVLDVLRTPPFRYLTRLFWPGPLTLLVHNIQKEKIGLRFPQDRVAAALINTVGVPFIATSANLSGEPSATNASQVIEKLGGKLDYIIDAGPCQIGKDSTIVDLTAEEPVILREGAEIESVQKAVEQIKVKAYPRKRILFVCTGNSCRSPMAEAWLRKQLKNHGYHDQIELASCGIGARKGGTPTMEAELVMKNREIDISAHRALPCTKEDVLNSDLIFVMSEHHMHFITGLVPNAKEKIRILNIPDPIGLGIMIYEEVIESIQRKLRESWNEIIQ